MRSLYVKNWRKFQHYKHRNPPWVKLHRSLFTSRDWQAWTDHDRLVALCCLSLASLDGGCLPDDPLWIKRVCHLTWRVDLKPLIKSGFLTTDASVLLADASTVLAKAAPENRVQRTETERTKANGHEIGKVGKSRKTKPTHGKRTKDGKRLWLDRSTTEWEQYASDYRGAHNGIDPPLQWNDAGTWFNLAGEQQH